MPPAPPHYQQSPHPAYGMPPQYAHMRPPPGYAAAHYRYPPGAPPPHELDYGLESGDDEKK